jgi:hypothetical protein
MDATALAVVVITLAFLMFIGWLVYLAVRYGYGSSHTHDSSSSLWVMTWNGDQSDCGSSSDSGSGGCD